MHSFWTVADLRRSGKSEREISRAIERGRMTPVRKGHLAVPGTAPVLLRCATVGGVATAVTAAEHLGIWTPPDPVPGSSMRRASDPRPADRVHVAVARKARLHDPDEPTRAFEPHPGIVIHRVDPDRLGVARRTGVAPVLLMLEHCFRSLPPDHALAVLVSALHGRHLSPTEVPALTARLPSHLGPVLALANGDTESGLETVVRCLLIRLGLRFEVLKGLRGIGTVDLLVEGRLIIELDGKRYHTAEEAFANDRRRDLVATGDRYRILRLTWFQVFFQREQVERGILAVVAPR